jgi:WD40 repeat protein
MAGQCWPLAVTELVGRVGRLKAYAQTDAATGLTLAARPLAGRAEICAMTPKGDLLAVTSNTGRVYCIHLDKNRYSVLEEAGQTATAATFMARLTRRLYVAFADNSLACYDANTSTQVARLAGSRSTIRSLSVRANSDQLTSATADSIALWEARTLRQQRLMTDAPYGTIQACFSPDEASLVAAAADGTLTLWCAKKQRLLGHFAAPGCAGESGRQRGGSQSGSNACCSPGPCSAFLPPSLRRQGSQQHTCWLQAHDGAFT